MKSFLTISLKEAQTQVFRPAKNVCTEIMRVDERKKHPGVKRGGMDRQCPKTISLLLLTAKANNNNKHHHHNLLFRRHEQEIRHLEYICIGLWAYILERR